MDREEYIRRTKNQIQDSYSDFDVLRIAYIFQQCLRRKKKCPIRQYCLVFCPEQLFETSNTEKLKNAVLDGVSTELGYKTDTTTFKNAIKNWPQKSEPIVELVETLARKIAPNLTGIIGPQLTAKLLIHTNGLKRLATLSSAKIQVLGAEKALAAHKKQGKPCPKYGYLYSVLQEKTGKEARQLANKLAIAAKIDHYRGKLNQQFIMAQ